jgi:heme-degrading monooxygenase HmoA
MIVGQTVFSVRKGTEHRAERTLHELSALLTAAPGHLSHRILRSVGMSPLASALHNEEREAALGDVHFVIETEWESNQLHDEFYLSNGLQQAYGMLSSILASGPYEVLYEALITHGERSGVAL